MMVTPNLSWLKTHPSVQGPRRNPPSTEELAGTDVSLEKVVELGSESPPDRGKK